ncbi:MAG TPA: TIGR02281 family clan AA aspartic protease [Candidatus Acidoferrum sp.]|nr:TIGR02281 family clan AA aspartic protease [Candidatus Acidoferrum sp.]
MQAFVAALLAFLFLPASIQAQSSDSVGAVMGSVASQNNILLEGAEVVLEGVGSVRSDSQGKFTFSRVSPGNYRLNVSKPGFTSSSRAMTVRGGGTAHVEVTLGGFAEQPTSQDWKVAVPLIRAGNAFLVRAILNGQREALFFVDTGAGITSISTGLAQALGISVAAGGPTVTITTASGVIRAPLATLESIQVGGAEARDVQGTVFDLPQSGQVAGLLGNTFLSRFHVQLDSAQGVLILSKQP